jgi:HK97 family phage major capsid protein
MSTLIKSLEIRSFPEKMEKRNSLLEKAERLIDKAKVERRNLDSSEQREVDKLLNEVKTIDKELDVEEAAHKAETRTFKPTGTVTEEQRAFLDLIRTGESRNLASANNGSVIPVSIAKQISDRVLEISPLVNEATLYTVSEDLNLPVYDYTDHVSAFMTEFVDIVESSGTFTSVPMKSKIIGTMSKLGKSLVNRTDLDVLPFIINSCAKSVARFLENEIITNANGQFASTLANGVTQTVATGTTGEIAPEEMVAMKNSIPSVMLPNAKWLMHKDTLSYLQSLTTTTGEFLYGNTLAEGNGNVILGHEVMLSDAMPTIGAGARQIYFGDFKEGLAIKIGAQSAEVYRELYAKQYALGVGHFIEVDVSASHSTQSISVLVGA